MSRSSGRSDTDSETESYDSSDYSNRRAALSLPDDVLVLIMSFLIPDDFDERRRTLSRLCLVCRYFYVFFNRELYRRVSIIARDSTERDSSTYRLLTHLALHSSFRGLIEEIAFDFTNCDLYRLMCINEALTELTNVRAFDLPAATVVAVGSRYNVRPVTQRKLRRVVLRPTRDGEFNRRVVASVRLFQHGELRLLGNGQSLYDHLPSAGATDLKILDVDLRICRDCFDLLTAKSQDTLTHLSILVLNKDFNLSNFSNLRNITIMSRAGSSTRGEDFFAVVTATLSSCADLATLRAVALTCGTGGRSLWPRWISKKPSMPLHTCLPTSLLSLDVADARFDYDDLVPLTNKRNFPSLRRIILSKDTLGSMSRPFDKCEPELIKSTVEGHAANRGVLVEWLAEA